MQIKYIEGGSPDFVVFINSKGDKARLEDVDGHFRWIVKEDDGTECIYRPISAQ